jgi:CheY-like chemotaxis protein
MNSVTFLLLEDDEVDIQAMRRTFHRMRLANPLLVARDGIEGLAILRGQGDLPALDRPYIVLLDLSMPRMGGIEFLEALRADPVLTGTVVFVLTTSAEEGDRVAAYQRHVAGYIVKSDLSGEGLSKAIDMLDHYWRVVELP